MFNHASGQLLPEHTWNPRCAQNFSWTHVQIRHQGNCCASTREIPATWINTQGRERCSCDKTAALARCEHTWISLRAHRDMFRRKDCAALSCREHTWISFRAPTDMFMRQHCCIRTPQAHLDLAPCAKRHVPAKRLLRSHARSTLGFRSVRKQTCTIEKTAALALCEHAWISLRPQTKRHVHATDCCFRTPQAHLDLSPCAKRHVPAKRLLRSHAASTLGSLGSRSVRKETCSIEKTAAISRCPPR